MPREGKNQFTMMIAEARRKLDEAKELQFFGGDALNLKRYEYLFTIANGDFNDRCWRVIMTPTRPNHTMPIDVGIKPGDATSPYAAQLEKVPTTNGTFEYLILLMANYTGADVKTQFFITYSGAATFNVTQIH